MGIFLHSRELMSRTAFPFIRFDVCACYMRLNADRSFAQRFVPPPALFRQVCWIADSFQSPGAPPRRRTKVQTSVA